MEDSVLNIFGLIEVAVPAYAKQLVLSALVGFIIGLERELKGKAASLRTFSMICVGSCLFTMLSLEASNSVAGQPYDVTRIAAQIVTGVGFLGGGVIFKTHDRIEGITTAALIWLAAAFGMACGFNRIELVVWGFLVGTLIHFLAFVFYEAIFFIREHNGSSEAEESGGSS